MNASTPDADVPAIESHSSLRYTLEILSEVTGISAKTILRYQEHGLIRSLAGDGSLFDDEAVRALRRIEHLRDTCEMNLNGLKLLAGLLEEIEELRAVLRARR
jgi:MerR family transcriptional regulator/heat shock protein HspR